MKLHATNHNVERGGNLVETNFTVRTTAKTFAILSSGLYSDKIAAPIRELCCNAYDAHVAAGNQEAAFEVTLPNHLNPTFSVRDYGTGLSNDDVRNLYTTYFDSTKTDSDEMIGALGLGSKSPFAYTSSFSIESRFNGKLSTFAAYINENGVPALSALMEDVPTTEPNGMTVSFPVKSDDISKFADRAKRILMYFPVKPVVHGYYSFEPHSLKHTVSGSNWKIRDAGYYAGMSGTYVVQGSVAYPLHLNNIVDQLSDAAAAVAATNLDLFLPIGQVEVAPSREALGYDTTTIRNLVAHIENAAGEMRDSIQEAINTAPNMWSARKMIHRMSNEDSMSSVFKPLHKHQPFTFKSLPIDTTITLDIEQMPSLAVEVLQVSSRYGRRGRGASIEVNIDRADHEFNAQISIIQQPNTITLVDDMGKGFTGTVRAYAKDLYNSNTSKNPHFVMIRPIDHKAGIDRADMEAVLQQLGGPETVTVTSIAPAVAAKKATYYRPRGKTERLVFTGFVKGEHGLRRKFSRLTWERREIDLNTGGFYVPIERFEVNQLGVHTAYIDEMTRLACDLSFFQSVPDIVGFTDKEMDSIAGDDSWVNLFDHMKESVQAYMADPLVIADAGRTTWLRDNYEVSSFMDVWSTISSQVKDGDFKDLMDDLSIRTTKLSGTYPKAERLAHLLQVSDAAAPITASAKTYTTRHRNLSNVYGMLQLISLRAITKQNAHQLVNYINTCEDAFAYADEHKAA
jgi:hypothetical protein